MCTMNKKILILILVALSATSNASAGMMDSVKKNLGHALNCVDTLPGEMSAAKLETFIKVASAASVVPFAYLAYNKFKALKAEKGEQTCLELISNNRKQAALLAFYAAGTLFGGVHALFKGASAASKLKTYAATWSNNVSLKTATPEA